MRLSFILISVLVFSSWFSEIKAADLTIEDYCDLSLSTPAGIKEMTPMPDGISFASLSDDGKKIEIYSFKTGQKIKDLFDVDAVKGSLKISQIDGFEISENGKKILVWNEKEKIYRYSFYAEYYVFDIFRSTLARVSESGKQRCAVISHDGRCVAYVRDNNIFISNLDYGTDISITKDGKRNSIINGAPDWSYEEEFDVLNTISWSADDNIITYLKFDETDIPEYSFDDYKGYCDSGFAESLYPSTYKYKYPLPGFGNSKVSVAAYNVDNKTTRLLDLPVSDTDYIPLAKFDADGNYLMVGLLNHEQNDFKIFKCNPKSTVCTQILNEKSDTWLSPTIYQKVKFRKNDFVIISERSGYKHLYLYDYSGNLKRQLTKGDYNVTDYYGSDLKGYHYLQSTIKGAINRNVCKVDDRGNLSFLEEREGTSSASFSSTFDYYLLTFSNSVTPPQYVLYDNKGKKTAELEMNEAYRKKYASAPSMEFLKVKNGVGEEMNAYIIKPKNFDSSRKYPLMMYQYNGPESQEVLNKWRMEGIFYIASQGYIVACVDGRGTGNRNSQWAKCVYKQLGILETEDQLAGAKYFSSLPFVDSNKTSCFGWSYGGYMTLMEMCNSNSGFKAGISMAGVADWRMYDAVYTERFMQTPSQNPQGYERASVLNKTHDLNGRLLLLSGTNDDNVHYYNSLKVASKLSAEGKVIDMMVYPGFEHSLRMCDARVQLFRKIIDFLNLNLK